MRTMHTKKELGEKSFFYHPPLKSYSTIFDSSEYEAAIHRYKRSTCPQFKVS
jgi:hypothetical protein